MPHQYSSHMVGYTSIDAKLIDEDEDEEGGINTSLRDSLTKDEKKSIKVLVNPYTNELVHVIPKEVARQVEKRVFGESPKYSPKDAQKAKHTLETELEQKWRMVAIQELKPRITSLGAFTEGMLRLILVFTLMQWGRFDRIDYAMVLGDMCPEDPNDDAQLKQAVQMLEATDLGHKILLALAIDDVTPSKFFENNAWVVTKDAPFIEELARACGLDIEPIKKRAKDELKAENSPPKTPAAKRPAARGADKAENADAKKTAAQSANKGASQKMPKAKKITAKEAQAGIAEALQKTEGASQ